MLCIYSFCIYLSWPFRFPDTTLTQQAQNRRAHLLITRLERVYHVLLANNLS